MVFFILISFLFALSLSKYKPQIIIYDKNTKATPEEEPNKSGVAKEHLEDCRDSDGSLDLAHPHLTSTLNRIQN